MKLGEAKGFCQDTLAVPFLGVFMGDFHEILNLWQVHCAGKQPVNLKRHLPGPHTDPAWSDEIACLAGHATEMTWIFSLSV